MKILAVVVFLVLININARIDAKRNNKGKGILFGNHLAAWIVRYAVAFFDILYIFYMAAVPYSWATVGLFLMYGGAGWTSFDLQYNKTRGLPLTFVGSTSWLDRIFRIFPNPFVAQLIAKLLVFVGGLLMFILL